MAGILLFTVAGKYSYNVDTGIETDRSGFAMMAYGTNQGTKLVGYCETFKARVLTVLIVDFTGASNATFSLSLSLVTGNVGGNTKKVVSSPDILVDPEEDLID